VNACFDSTYVGESVFSTMKILKSKYRSLNDCMRVALVKYTPSYKLAGWRDAVSRIRM